MKKKYKYSVINIGGLEIDFGVIGKWLKHQEEGEYVVTIEKITKKDE